MRREEKPTRCHWMFYYTYNMLNMGLLGPAWCKLFMLFYYTLCSTCFGCNTHPSSGATHNVHADDTSKCTCELTCSTPCLACKDGCVLHPKHVEQKCNKITLNNLHQAGPNKPKLSTVYGNRRLVTVLVRALRMSVPWARQSIPHHLIVFP